MTRALRFTKAARENFREISEFVTEQSSSEDVAESFASQLAERCRRIATLPGTLGTARPELRTEIRSTPHKDYLIFFRYERDAVEIVNVLHGSRDLDTHSFGDT